MIDAIRSHFGKAWKLSGAVSRGFPDGEGLRYHGMAPSLSTLVRDGYVEPRAYDQVEALSAAACSPGPRA